MRNSLYSHISSREGIALSIFFRYIFHYCRKTHKMKNVLKYLQQNKINSLRKICKLNLNHLIKRIAQNRLYCTILQLQRNNTDMV